MTLEPETLVFLRGPQVLERIGSKAIFPSGALARPGAVGPVSAPLPPARGRGSTGPPRVSWRS